jgi:hypothetical protein
MENSKKNNLKILKEQQKQIGDEMLKCFNNKSSESHQMSTVGDENVGEEFELQIDKSMQDLEHYSTKYDSDSDIETNVQSNKESKKKQLKKTKTVGSSSDTSCSEDEEELNAASTFPLKATEALNKMLFPKTPLPLPFCVRRKLSECKEEEEEEAERALNGSRSSASNGKVARDSPEKSKTVANTSNETAKTKKRFTVTKTAAVVLAPSPRREIVLLKNLNKKSNSQTIHFPCASPIKPSLHNLFSPQMLESPHLDNRFFDASLVEIRPTATSTKSLDEADAIIDEIDDVWIKREQSDKKVVSYY